MNHGSHSPAASSPTDAACKISMMWNWYTIDSCFISQQWHVRSIGGFVGTVIGVFLIVVALEAFRRLSREYDTSIRKAYYLSETAAVNALGKGDVVRPFRTTFTQHLIRSVFYGVQFGTSYMLMLLAMYYNGAVILAIFGGAFVGYLITARDTINPGGETAASRGECCC